MIPVSLRMHNFMPYKGDAPPLSFTSIHTACISGDNGAGKSSIIDAITWVLWGRSRAKSDDERATILAVMRHRAEGAPPDLVPANVKNMLAHPPTGGSH